ncbi:MAG: hypothetical protein COV44_11515 [Deltaproteobacteria bacterium CG11_big_fil_rev_8_21_14_0_20_45_16]|nr:MAG: hypothetical protein COV44_11515 [Deltaproteobacteria bacterium CG11_big_fil_rev_8_21_14_0_20_45_16]
MKTLSKKDKRAGIRVPLLSEKVLFFVSTNQFDADVGDITTEGVFLKSTELLKPQTAVNIQFSLPGDLGLLSVEGKVVRVNWAINRKRGKEHLGLGIRFENLTEGTKKILDAYVVYLRNKQIISVSKRIIEEFFGANKNPKS